MSRVLVTGASGYIGRQVVNSLVEAGFSVHCSSRQRTTRSPAWHAANLLVASERQRLLTTVRPTHLVHLAWCTEHGRFWTDPSNDAWAEATLNLAHDFVAGGGRRLVVAGTCAEYDWTGAGNDALHETQSPRRPATLYGRAKLSTQERLSAYAENVGLSYAWAVLFFSFGPYEDRRRLVPSVITSVLAGKVASVRSASLRRDLLDVRDTGGAIAALLASPVLGRVNVASGSAVSLGAIAREIGDILGRPDLIAVAEESLRSGEPTQLVADVRRLHEDVGFQPRYMLREALASTVDWWRTAPV